MAPDNVDISIASIIYVVIAIVLTLLCGSAAIMLPMQTVVEVGKLYINNWRR